MQNVNAATTGQADLEEELRLALSGFIAAMQSGDAARRAAALDLFRTGLLPENQDRIVGMLVADLDSGVGAKRDAAAGTLTAVGLPAMMPRGSSSGPCSAFGEVVAWKRFSGTVRGVNNVDPVLLPHPRAFNKLTVARHHRPAPRSRPETRCRFPTGSPAAPKA